MSELFTSRIEQANCLYVSLTEAELASYRGCGDVLFSVDGEDIVLIHYPEDSDETLEWCREQRGEVWYGMASCCRICVPAPFDWDSDSVSELVAAQYA